jgi:hypothetical protein
MSNPYDGVWAAWLNTMPGTSPWKLHVKGTLQMPTPGFTLTLKESSPQGIDANVLLLDLIVTPPDPDIIVPQVITEEEARFEKPTGIQYKTITILPDGPDIVVEIVS